MTALLVVASVAILFFLCRSIWLHHKSQQLSDRQADALQVLARLAGTRRRVHPLAAPKAEPYEADLEELLEGEDEGAEDTHPTQAWAGPPPAPPPLGVLDPPAQAPAPRSGAPRRADWLRWAAAGAVVAGVLAAAIAPLHAGSGHHRLVIIPAGVVQPPPVAAWPAPHGHR